MKIYGFTNRNTASCGSDTRFMSDKELLVKLNNELRSAKQRLAEAEEEMELIAKLENTYKYNLVESVGICFINIDSLNAEILDITSKIKRLKDERR